MLLKPLIMCELALGDLSTPFSSLADKSRELDIGSLLLGTFAHPYEDFMNCLTRRRARSRSRAAIAIIDLIFQTFATAMLKQVLNDLYRAR
nr:hypothetical protein CFP56_10022 [Quercus suber]